MQLALEVKNAEIIAYEIKGRNLYKKGRESSFHFVPGHGVKYIKTHLT